MKSAVASWTRKYRAIRFAWLIFLGQLLLTQLSYAQTEIDTTYRHVVLKDGNTFTGRIVRTGEDITIETATYGQITFKMADVVSITTPTGARVVNGQVWLKNPQSTRYLWAPNGYGLKKGEGYYQNIWVMFNQVAVGISDNFSLGGGTVPLFLFDGSPTPLWITPKFSVPVKKDKFNVGGGALFGTILGEDGLNFGILYGITTFGGRDKNLSLGMGWGYGDGEWATSPTITVNALVRTGPKGYFVTENYYIDAGGTPLVLFSAGGRRMINKFSLDFALAIPFSSDIDGFIALPFLGFAVPFGEKPGATGN